MVGWLDGWMKPKFSAISHSQKRWQRIGRPTEDHM